jgi:hypothetical protein
MKITINLTDEEIKYLENDIVDIEKWIKNAVKGKIYKCKCRLFDEWQEKLINDPTIDSIPANESDLLTVIINHADYKNRKSKEKEMLL